MTETTTTDGGRPAEGTHAADYTDAYYLGGHLGPPYTYDEPHWRTFFGGVADSVVALFAPTTTYDAGCAIGLLVRAMLERGVDAYGGDISEFAVSGAPDGLRERLEVRNLVDPFDRRYDVITCIEVLEHMSAGDSQLAIANLCAATDTILLSSTPEDFREPTHVNVRTPASWAQDFAAHGFFRRTDIDASFLSPWAVVFTRQSPTAVQTVAAYESLLAPLSREVLEKRQALLEVQRDLERARGVVSDEREQLQAEIARLTAACDEAVAARARIAHDRDRLQDELVELRGNGSPDEQLVRLALVDELMGVRAELAQARMRADNAVLDAFEEADRLAVQLREVRESVTWRLGRAAMTPVRVARRVRGR
jgi:SAM-dependent methyltransferase